MEPVAIVSCLALLQYFVFAYRVGGARQASGIAAPAMTGDVTLERRLRVQLNTLETLAIYLPSLWMFAYYVQPLAAALIGLVYILGRALYARNYERDPSTRTSGFMLTVLSFMVLLLGSLIGAVLAWLL